jgi:peptidoglycan/LPS O-acetylase OafA/YrhL
MTTPAARKPLAAAFDLQANLRALLHRPARQDDHFAPVDGLRAFSVLWVVIFHVTGEMGRGLASDSLLVRFLRRGFLGVDVFFVISGFLIGSLVLRERRDCGRVAVGRFYFRRALRVLPAYWVTLAVYCAMLGVNSENVAWNLAFVNNFLPASRQCMSWAWSLAVEEQFYLLFPAFVWLLNRVPQHRRLSFLFAMLALAFVVRGTFIFLDDLYVPGPMRDRRWLETFCLRTHVRYGGLLCGVIAAYLLLHTDVLARFRRSVWRVPLLLASTAVIADLALRRQVFEYGWPNWLNFAYLTTATYLFAMAIACLMLASIAGVSEVRWLSRLLQARWLFPIGQLSYASYLVHLLIIQSLAESGTLGRARSLPDLAWNALVVLVATFGVATAVYLMLERPLMNLRDLRRQPRASENAAVAVGEAA